MLTLKQLPTLSSFQISRNVFSPTSTPRGFLYRYWWVMLILTIALATGSFVTYAKAIEWWNTEIHLKKQVAEVDVTDPIFTKALVQWIRQRSAGVPNTDPEMLTQIVVTAFTESAKRQVDPFLTLAVISVESRFNYMASNPSGARGLMQIIPYWHKDKISAVEVFNPVANVKAGTMVLQEYLASSNGNVNTALLKYNGALHIPGANYDTKVLKVRHDIAKFVENRIRAAYVNKI